MSDDHLASYGDSYLWGMNTLVMLILVTRMTLKMALLFTALPLYACLMCYALEKRSGF